MNKMQNDNTTLRLAVSTLDNDNRTTFLLATYVAWLNYEGVAAEDFRTLTELAQCWAREASAGRYRRKEQMAWHRKTHPLCERITKKYPSVPHLLMTSPRSGAKLYVADIPRTKRARGREWEAWFAMSDFRKILDAGLLFNIGRCTLASCRQYFHGRIGKRFCSDECARKHMRQTPDYKKKNAEHQRAHYQKYFAGRRGKHV
jgi:hypothetical protein